jgi:hypothetical protein
MQDAGKDSPIVPARFSRRALRQMGSNVFHASSDSQTKLLAMPSAPSDSNHGKIYHGINALYGF